MAEAGHSLDMFVNITCLVGMSLGKENGRGNTNKNTKDVYELRDD